jgi:murein DD-endopeptidase MepM/ murein hydrolase activator NlpD
MNSKQLGLQEYNDIVLSMYDANPIVNISESIKKTEELANPEPEERKPKKVGSNLLRKETYKLKLAAVANFKLTKRIFSYEKRRLKQLTVDFGKIKSAKGKEIEGNEGKKRKKKKDQDQSIRGWFRKLIQDFIKNLKNKLKDSLKKFLKRRYIRNYKKLSPKQRARVRARKKFFDRQKAKYNKFRKRGGLKGFASRRLKRLGTSIVGKRNAARLRLFRQTGGVKGVARRAFFGATRSLVSTAKSAKGIAGIAFDTIRGPGAKVATTAATEVASKAGRGVIVQTARNALVGTLGKGGTKQLLKFAKNYISPLLKKIPVIGTLIDFALNVFVFKESLGKSAFKAISAGLMAWLGGAIGSIIPVAGTVVGAALGGWAGDALGGMLYDSIFGGGVNAEESPPSDKDASQLELNQFSEGGKVPAKPQLVLVGEGGEEEFIIPKSKLSWFLGSDAATNAVNDSIGQLAGAVQGYLKDTGLFGIASGVLPGLAVAKTVAKKTVRTGLRAIRSISASEVIDKIVTFITDAFGKIRDWIGKFVPDLKNLSEPLKIALSAAASAIGGPLVPLVNFMLGGSARAATTPPQAPLTGGGYEYTDPDTKVKLTVMSKRGMRIHPITGKLKMHEGTDIAAPSGTPLRAISDGEIVDSDSSIGGWGNFLVFKDDRGYYHLYGHMQGGHKRSGSVKKGDVIGKVGSTGASTGPHLHWEIGTGWDRGNITGYLEPLDVYEVDAPFFTKRKEETSGKKLSKVDLNNAIRALGGDPNTSLDVPRLTQTKDNPVAIAPLNKKDTASNLEQPLEYEEDMLVAMEPQVIIKTQYIPIPLGGGSSVASSAQTSSSWLPAVLGA